MQNLDDFTLSDYERIGDLISNGVMITDANLVIRWWNRWFTDHTLQAAAAVAGTPLFELFPDLQARHLDAPYQRALEGQTVVLSQRLHGYLLPLPVADESASQFRQMQQSAQIAPFTRDGAIVGTITLVSDVTERVAREQELERLLGQEQAARRDLERSVTKIEQMLAITTALAGALTPAEIAEVVISKGGGALDAYGGILVQLTTEDDGLEIVYAQGYPPEVVAAWAGLRRDTGMPVTDAVARVEPVFIHSRDELAARYPRLAAQPPMERTHALAAFPLAVQGRVVGALGLSFAAEQAFGAEDRAFLVTLALQGALALERARLYELEQRARARAESAVMVRDQFLSIAAHDFRTPLTSMLGNAQLLQRRLVKAGGIGEPEGRLLQVVVDQGRRLTEMVSLLLDVSRLEAGRFTLVMRPLDLELLVRRLIEEHQASDPGHQISFDGPGHPVMVSGEDLRLVQVFQNLISNAIKYTLDGKGISVVMHAGDAQVTVSVHDQGIGIPAAALPHLFTQFFRAANVESHQIDGVGIGLYIVREIIIRHGGSIDVKSVEGQGSIFTVLLPLLQE